MPPTLALEIKNMITLLRERGIASPELEAKILACHALGIDRTRLLMDAQRDLSPEEISRIQQIVKRRLAHEPIGRIIGEREFWSLPFGLNEATLEPRPDSETLVEVAAKKHKNTRKPRILDLGTGTGCLLLALLHELPEATGVGVDVAPRAVEQAKSNAARLGFSSRADFQVSNWLENVSGSFDAIISNPPYIPAAEIPSLMPEVRDHDPLRALDGGEDGLTCYRFLIPKLPAFLKPNAFVIFEVGTGQANDVAALLSQNGFSGLSKHKDLGGIERCVMALRI